MKMVVPVFEDANRKVFSYIEECSALGACRYKFLARIIDMSINYSKNTNMEQMFTEPGLRRFSLNKRR